MSVCDLRLPCLYVKSVDPNLLLVLIVGCRADANECADKGAEDGRYLSHDFAVAPPKNLVKTDKSGGASGDADKYKPFKYKVNFVGEFHTRHPFSNLVLIIAMSLPISSNRLA